MAPDDEEIGVEEWRIFGRYRRVLGELGAEDPEGHALWAAARFANRPPAGLDHFPRVAVLEPADVPAVHAALRGFHGRADHLSVTLEIDEAPLPRFAFEPAESLRNLLQEMEFDEDFQDADPHRPAGLRLLGENLFRDDEVEPTDEIEGIRLLGAPRGEGIPLVVARRVQDLLDAGAEPEEVVILVPRLDDEARRIAQTLRSWGIAARCDAEQPLIADPAVAALRSVLRLAIDGWEVAALARTLRNGWLRPDWPEARGPQALAAAARAIQDARVHRGRAAISDRLRRTSKSPQPRDDRAASSGQTRAAERAAAALPVFDRLANLLEPLHRASFWLDHLDRWRFLIQELGIAATEGLRQWEDALEDHGATLERLGRGRERFDEAEFLDEAVRIAREARVFPPSDATAGVRVLPLVDAEGASARHVLLANLAEGTLPSRRSSAPTDEALGSPLGREMARFLKGCGSARESLTLVYPTTDEQGHRLLASGFLDDLRRIFTGDAWERACVEVDRFDPVLPEALAQAPAEARVRAVARSCNFGEFDPLNKLLADPAHREGLLRTAHALKLAHWRSRRGRFGPYDGQINGSAAKSKIAEDFGPDRPAYSASALESLALCPFQFFQKYVLKLTPADAREELEDDPTTRGQIVHKALENLHVGIRDLPGPAGATLADRVDAEVERVIATRVEAFPPPSSEVEAGLRRIEAERLRRAGRRYASQFRRYAAKEGAGAACEHFEVEFGTSSEHDKLRLGTYPRSIDMRGMIDRIDRIERDGRRLFRIIDYKTGSAPDQRAIDEGTALQLSLYALAAERVVLAHEEARPLDAAYWEVRDKGFLKRHTMTSPANDPDDQWTRHAGDLEAFVVDLAERLRQADFAIAPRREDCTRTCDYQFVCRIKQVRRAEKVWVEAPRLGRPS